ncbi:TPA: hypothetical protein R4Y37_005042 [Citrobacter freundii]|nr:hypothetical protein [Citrobacter freundii]
MPDAREWSDAPQARCPAPFPAGELPFRFVHASGRDRKEKGATGKPATPS